MFHSLGRSWRSFTEADDALSIEMVNAWTNFAIYNDPNGKDNTIWTPYTSKTPQCVVFKLNEAETEPVSGMG